VLRLGVLLVLLVPCTDWFITFSQLAGGDVPRAIAVTAVNLLLQLLLLPLYVWAMAGSTIGAALTLPDVAPRASQWCSCRWLLPRSPNAGSRRGLERVVLRGSSRGGLVPLLALVVFLIAGAQVGAVRDALGLLPVVVPLFAVFVLLAGLAAKALARLFRLTSPQGRTLAFSLGTRNSFVVLPFALTLPPGWEPASVVIVVQSLVELFGMTFFLWWVPGRLFRS
jgi:ACR3 family arsenite efflux pump ArsB